MKEKNLKTDVPESFPSLQGVLDFLSLLQQHNDRDWFAAHKESYLGVRAQVEDFTSWIISKMLPFDNELALTVPKRCIYRIYRDTRFSPDKRPYKNHIGIGISRQGRHGLCSGYYIHLEPGMCMYGAGVYGLEPAKLKKVRDGIYFQSARLRAILAEKQVKRIYGGCMEEAARMKLPPKGYDKGFPDIDLLKYRYYFLEHRVSDQEVEQSGYALQVLEGLKAAAPFNKFLNEALDF